MVKVFCACFLGQGGYTFSMGMVLVAKKLRGIGAETQTFKYHEFELARAAIRRKRRDGYRVTAIGFSLGCTSATYLALTEPLDALLCIAESVYAGPNNHPVSNANVKRSVLWRNSTEKLSAAGGDLGFDQIIELRAPHVMMPVKAADAVVNEVKQLMRTS